MAILQGFAIWPGVAQVRRGRYTMTHGTTPDVAILQIIPQPASSIARDGDLLFTFGSTIVSIRNCRIDFGTLYISSQGQVTELHIFDRRWKWRFGEIRGLYNLRDSSGVIVSSTQRTPQQLATLLLDAMGEFGYDVSQLPNTGNPTVYWDCSNPARELEKLCGDRGCRIALGLDNATRIVRLGFGAPLPFTELRTIANGINSAEAPNQVRLCGAAVIFESKLNLEAVGEDVDGSIVPIDTLTYASKLTSGWSAVAEDTEQMLIDLKFTEQERRLARKTAWKWWRITSQADGSLPVPGYSGIITSMDQLLPLAAERNVTYTDSAGKTRLAPAFIEGTFLVGGDPGAADDAGTPANGNTPAHTVYEGEFTIDKKQGIVKFPQPMRKSSGGLNVPADLFLTTTYNARDPDQIVRFERWQTVDPTVATAPEIIRRDEVEVLVTAQYGAGDTVVTGTTDNQAAMDSLADQYIFDYAIKYQNFESFRAQYRGILPFQLDGAIRQVTWEASNKSGSNTWVSYNNEFEVGVLRHEKKRIRQDVLERARFDDAENAKVLREARGR